MLISHMIRYESGNLRLLRTRSLITISSLWLWHHRMSIECITLIFEAISFNLLSFNFLLCISLFIFCKTSQGTRATSALIARESRIMNAKDVPSAVQFHAKIHVAAWQRNNRAGSWERVAQNSKCQSPKWCKQHFRSGGSKCCCSCGCCWSEAELRLGLCVWALSVSLARSTVHPISATTDWHAKWTAARTAARAGQPNDVLCSMCVCAPRPRAQGIKTTAHTHTCTRVINAKTTLFHWRHKNTHTDRGNGQRGTSNGRA